MTGSRRSKNEMWRLLCQENCEAAVRFPALGLFVPKVLWKVIS